MSDATSLPERRQLIFGGLFLGSLAAIYFALYQPVLHVDDWGQTIYKYEQGYLTWFAADNRRPLLYASILFVYRLFGESISAFYAITGVLTLAAGLQLYWLLRRLIPILPWVPVLASALFLVYPADYTRMYITVLHIRLSIFFVLLYAMLLLAYAESRSPYRSVSLFLALVCLILSFGFYEAQLGIGLMFALLLAVFKSNKGTQRAALLCPILVGVAFAWWRTVGMRSIGVSDHFLQKLQLGPGLIITRLVAGLRVLVIAWTEPVTRLLGVEKPGVALLIIYAVVAITIFAVKFLVRDKHVEIVDAQTRASQIKQTLLVAITGGVFTVAGYVPIIILYTPTLNGRASRTNLFATFGAAVIFIAFLRLIVLLVAKNRPQVTRLLIGVTIPFVLLGLVTQAWIQYDANVAWEEQRQIWRGLFEVAPDLEPETAVYIRMPGYEERYSLVDWRRAPLSASWEVSAALRVLYEDNSLNGDILLPDLPLPQAEVTREGFLNSYTGEVIPYDKALLVEFDRESQSVGIIENLSEELSLSWNVDSYAPMERIRKTPGARDTPWHRLILSE